MKHSFIDIIEKMNEINDNGNCPVCLSNLKEPYINCVECEPNTQLCLRVSIYFVL